MGGVRVGLFAQHTIFGGDQRGFVRLHAGDLDKPAERQHSDVILGVAAFAEAKQALAEADAEIVHPNAAEAGDNEMAPLMGHHENA